MLRRWSERKKGVDNDNDEPPAGGNPQGGGDEDEMTREEAQQLAEEAVQKALTAAGIKTVSPAAASDQVVVTDSDALAGAISKSLEPTLKAFVDDAVRSALVSNPIIKGLVGTVDQLGTHIDDHMEALSRSNADAFKGLVTEFQKGFVPTEPVTPTAPVAPVVPTTPVVPVANGSVIGQPAAQVAVTKAVVQDGGAGGENAYELMQKGLAQQQSSGQVIPGLSELSIAVSAQEAIDPALIARVTAGINAAQG